MSVVVQLRGGLGNQLFQYAAGYALSRRLGTSLELDVALLPVETVERGGVRRWPEQISGFRHDGKFIDSAKGSAVRRRILQSTAGWERRLGDTRFRRLLGDNVYARETTEDYTFLESLSGNGRINAYCNSPSYFHAVSGDLIDQVRDLKNPGEWFLSELAAIESARPIALHIRWGDYLNLKHVFGTIPPSYYKRSIALLERMSGSSRPIWLFSDDPSGASEYLGDQVNLDRVVQPPRSSTALENLVLLSGASAFVCANSTFSWWAAYLSGAGAGSVIFPRPLYAEAGPAEPKDWLSADWLQVGAHNRQMEVA